MATLAEFHARLSKIINRGTVYDAEIPDYVRDATKEIERRHTFKQMERFVRFPTPTTDNCFGQFPRIKSFNFFRLVVSGATPSDYHYMNYRDGEDITIVATAKPNRYWADADQFIWFDNIPDQAYVAELNYNQYIDWPTAGSSTNYLLGIYEDLLLAHSVIECGPRIRTPGLIAAYESKLERKWASALDADTEFRYQDQFNIMNFGVDYDDDTQLTVINA